MLFVFESPYFNEETQIAGSMIRVGYCKEHRFRATLNNYRANNPAITPICFIEHGTNKHRQKIYKHFGKLRYEKNPGWFYYNQDMVDFLLSATLEDIEKL